MKNTKRQKVFFSFYDHTGIEAHLGRMAQQGWLLEKIGNSTWHYRRIEPKRLTFSVCYFPKASQFDPGPSQEQETFYDFCAHTGWELAASSAQMQIFYNERENPTPIDTDPALEVETIHKSAKKGWLISQAMLIGVSVLNLAMLLWRLADDPIRTLSHPASLFQAVCWPMILLSVGFDAANYFLWLRRAREAAEQGEFLATKSRPWLQLAPLAVVLAEFIWLMSALTGVLALASAVSVIGILAVILLVSRLRETLKRNGVPARTNFIATLAACIVLALLVTAATVYVTISALRGQPGSSAADGLPLTLNDLMDYDGGSSDSLWQTESPLLARIDASQHPRTHEDMAGGAPSLSYTVTVVKVPALYGLCKNALLHKDDWLYENRPEDQRRWYAPSDPAPWGAQEAYRWTSMDMADFSIYLLCYPDRLVTVNFDYDWQVTPEQMAVVAEKLGGVQAP